MATPFLSTLPSRFERGSFSYVPRSGSDIEFSDGGSPMTTPRFTGYAVDVSGILVCDVTQARDLITWWRDTLKQGALPFTWVDPLYETAADFVFAAPPEPRPHGFAWDVTLKLVQVPQ